MMKECPRRRGNVQHAVRPADGTTGLMICTRGYVLIAFGVVALHDETEQSPFVRGLGVLSAADRNAPIRKLDTSRLRKLSPYSNRVAVALTLSVSFRFRVPAISSQTLSNFEDYG